MVFGRGKPLGPRGLFWLKVHLANMSGKRGTLADRVEFVEQNMDNILNSADFPLAGERRADDECIVHISGTGDVYL
jgi:DNA-directed RNA polymerase, mitochondrial